MSHNLPTSWFWLVNGDFWILLTKASSHFSALSPASIENIWAQSESFLLKQEMEERRRIITLRYNPEHSTKHCFSDVSVVFSFSWLTSASTFEALAIASSIAILSSSLTLAVELRGSEFREETQRSSWLVKLQPDQHPSLLSAMSKIWSMMRTNAKRRRESSSFLEGRKVLFLSMLLHWGWIDKMILLLIWVGEKFIG